MKLEFNPWKRWIDLPWFCSAGWIWCRVMKPKLQIVPVAAIRKGYSIEHLRENGDSDVDDSIMSVNLWRWLFSVCWWFSQCIKSVNNILNRSPTSQTCQQHIWSPTTIINIDVTNYVLWLHWYCRQDLASTHLLKLENVVTLLSQLFIFDQFWVCYRKVGCVFLISVASMSPHAEIGRNDHRGNAPHFSSPQMDFKIVICY